MEREEEIVVRFSCICNTTCNLLGNEATGQLQPSREGAWGINIQNSLLTSASPQSIQNRSQRARGRIDSVHTGGLPGTKQSEEK